MEKFNSNLKQFTEQIIKLYPEQEESIREYYKFDDLEDDKYLQMFYNNCIGKGDDISSKNEIIFSEENIILENINFYKIWNSDKITEENKENIWKYLHTLYIFAYETVKERDIKTILKELKNISSDSENLDEDTKTLLNIIDSLTGKYTKNVDIESNSDEETGDNTFAAPEMFNGVIGDLAKEIADEIDPTQLNLDDPSQLLKDLMSGNFDEKDDKSGIVNLVKNITGKIQDKLSSGNLDETQLFSEAQNVMNSFGKGNSFGKNNPMGNIFNQMMQSGMMAGMSENEMDIVNNAQNIINNGGQSTNISAGQLKNNLDKQKTRDRLKKKLEDKKRLLKEKEEELAKKETNNNYYDEDIDLDKLAAEIEGISSDKKPVTNIKKRKKKEKKTN